MEKIALHAHVAPRQQGPPQIN